MSFTKVRFQADLPPFLSLLAVGIASALSLWCVTYALGASFGAGAEAALRSCLVMTVACGIQSLIRWPASVVGCAVPALLWPCWWPALKSMALRRVDPATGVVPLHWQQTWYDSPWCKTLVEIGLLALFAWAVTHARRKPQPSPPLDTPAEPVVPLAKDPRPLIGTEYEWAEK